MKIIITSPTARLVTEFINRSDKKQAQISEEIGLSPKSNALTLFKSGKSPLPVGRSKALADACGCSESERKLLVATCLLEHHKEAVAVLDVFSPSFMQDDIMGAVRPVDSDECGGYVESLGIELGSKLKEKANNDTVQLRQNAPATSIISFKAGSFLHS
jgi:hypothetical protein